MTDLTHYLLSNTEETADFASSSRYAGAPLNVMTDDRGTERVFVSRRFLPQPASIENVQSMTIREGDRLDLLGAAYYADPTLWWRIADANLVQNPSELLTIVGRRIALHGDEGEQ
ncbi:hypothetical protein A1OO_15305 [Enterovibrio norvegicus FF-33]|uniref:LysM domain-containing protein n=1 Tax=Enterovibrio norvegicus FF-454 TaxID=1185651 RepID=A0A1E5BWN5_9GAMM|nr:hypothetical protein [Enterovibrio norvegicus]OEE57664.1 hypothetical protein A1OK_17035 [Enterovibrio norvegicus FF-454]OEE67122.1 hypothetical protein A1OO_15305 [Enterovibrio norvegicus FF-33]